MQKLSFSIVLLSVFLFSSCIFGDDEKDVDESYKIEYGFACGWCGGTGSIELVNGQIRYKREIPCGDEKGTDTRTDKFSPEQWNDLISSYDYDYYLGLEYSECNVCVDGCDEIITITKDEITHELRYDPGDTIPGLEVFQEKLRALMLNYQKD